jgi:hypothetical protein
MRALPKTGATIGIAIATAALIPFFMHEGPCDQYAAELGLSNANIAPDPYGQITCDYFGFEPSAAVLPGAYLIGLLVLAFGVAQRIAKSRDIALLTMISLSSGLLAGVVGFAASGLSIFLLLTDPGTLFAVAIAFCIGLIVRWVDRHVAA